MKVVLYCLYRVAKRHVLLNEDTERHYGIWHVALIWTVNKNIVLSTLIWYVTRLNYAPFCPFGMLFLLSFTGQIIFRFCRINMYKYALYRYKNSRGFDLFIEPEVK